MMVTIYVSYSHRKILRRQIANCSSWSQGWYWCVALGQPQSHVNADHPSLKVVPVLALLIVHVCTILPRMGMWGNNR